MVDAARRRSGFLASYFDWLLREGRSEVEAGLPRLREWPDELARDAVKDLSGLSGPQQFAWIQTRVTRFAASRGIAIANIADTKGEDRAPLPGKIPESITRINRESSEAIGALSSYARLRSA